MFNHYLNKCKFGFTLAEFFSPFCTNIRKYAFTLAEVLITLGIIGVVAALTISQLVTNYQKMVTVNQLKVAYQVFTEAMQHAIAEYSVDGKKIYIVDDELGAGGNNPALSAKYIDPYIKGAVKFSNIKERSIRIKNVNKSGDSSVMYSRVSPREYPMCIPKGFCYWVVNHGNNYTHLIIDLNSTKGPNVLGRDVFAFELASDYVPAKGRQYITLPHPFYDYKNDYNTLCNKTSTSNVNGLTCASKIINDGWKIAPDYPW